jgi:hypothetical protein
MEPKENEKTNRAQEEATASSDLSTWTCGIYTRYCDVRMHGRLKLDPPTPPLKANVYTRIQLSTKRYGRQSLLLFPFNSVAHTRERLYIYTAVGQKTDSLYSARLLLFFSYIQTEPTPFLLHVATSSSSSIDLFLFLFSSFFGGASTHPHDQKHSFLSFFILAGLEYSATSIRRRVHGQLLDRTTSAGKKSKFVTIISIGERENDKNVHLFLFFDQDSLRDGPIIHTTRRCVCVFANNIFTTCWRYSAGRHSRRGFIAAYVDLYNCGRIGRII